MLESNLYLRVYVFEYLSWKDLQMITLNEVNYVRMLNLTQISAFCIRNSFEYL